MPWFDTFAIKQLNTYFHNNIQNVFIKLKGKCAETNN